MYFSDNREGISVHDRQYKKGQRNLGGTFTGATVGLPQQVDVQPEQSSDWERNRKEVKECLPTKAWQWPNSRGYRNLEHFKQDEPPLQRPGGRGDRGGFRSKRAAGCVPDLLVFRPQLPTASPDRTGAIQRTNRTIYAGW